MLREIKLYYQKIFESLKAPLLIKDYLAKTKVGKRKLILGGHWSNHPGWLILNENHQDITKKLKIPAASFDVVFIEHVFEHVEFGGGLFFLKEAKRILRKGGTIRIVSPFLERVVGYNFGKKNKRDQIYIANSLVRLSYPHLEKFIKADPKTFFLNSLFRENEHHFIWSSKLLKGVMESLGYKDVRVLKPGQSRKKEYAIERRHRGIYLGSDWKKDRKLAGVFDPESLAVEAIK